MSLRSKNKTAELSHVNGETWLDAAGDPIQAHGGGVLIHDGVYYWYGENRAGRNRQVDGKARSDSVGVSCYRSVDLMTWTHLGVVLPAVDEASHDLHIRKVIERPKVIYNQTTRQFVMWLHVDSADYSYARAGVAVADSPAGPFRYLHSLRPNGFMSRDQTVVRDGDGRAYHVAASDENATAMVSLLSEDYLNVSGNFVKVFPGRRMEAFAFTRHQNRYWMIASGCTGWAPNAARSAVADDMMGPWEELLNPCEGDNAELAFGGQSTCIIPPGPANHDHIAMLDLWRPQDLKSSRYVWLPVQWEDGRMRLRYREVWTARRHQVEVCTSTPAKAAAAR